jgi:hypothetical protein
MGIWKLLQRGCMPDTLPIFGRRFLLAAPKAVVKTGYNGIQHASKSTYEAGSSLLASPKKTTLKSPPGELGKRKGFDISPEPGNGIAPMDSVAESLIDYSDGEEDPSGENVVEDLLSAWINFSS